MPGINPIRVYSNTTNIIENLIAKKLLPSDSAQSIKTELVPDELQKDLSALLNSIEGFKDFMMRKELDLDMRNYAQARYTECLKELQRCISELKKYI